MVALGFCPQRPLTRGGGAHLAFRFSDYVLDPERRELRCGIEPVAVEPQVFDLLLYLICNRDRVVTKDELIAEVWRGRIVSDSTLTSRLNAARRVVNDSGTSQRVIRTIARKGIRFVAEVSEEEDANIAAVTPERPRAPRLSIIVLPFANLSDDAEQRYFADGITGDLTTGLSRLPDMLVISRNTAFTYRDRPVDTRRIGRDLNVRYVLEGEVQRSGNRVRVTAQLIDAENDAHLWAERFGGDTDDLFALQEEITSRIAATLDLELVEADAARPIEQPDALDYILRGRAARLQPPSRENRALAIDLFERALALDPISVGSQSWLAVALTARVLDSMACNPVADIARAAALAEQALAVSPRRALAHFAMAQVLRAQHRYEDAIFEYEATVALNPNWAHAYSHLGWCRFMTGEIIELIPAQERAIRRSPRDPQIGLFYSRIGCAHHLEGRLEEAIAWFEKARAAAPGHPQFRAFLASAYALAGQNERGTSELAEARRLVGDDRYSSIARLRDEENWGAPAIRPLVEQTYFAGLRMAGLSER